MFDRFRRRELLGDESGSMVIEFGLIVPLLVILISGLVEFGMAYTIRMNLSHAAREGVRVYALVDGGAWKSTAEAAAGTAPPGVPDAIATSSNNCLTPSRPPTTPTQSSVEVRRSAYPIRIAFIPAITVDLTGRAVMRCGG